MFKCSICSLAMKRSDNLKRHLKNVHGIPNNTVVPVKLQVGSSQLGGGVHRTQAKPEDGLYTKEEFEEAMSTIRGRFPTMNFDTLDPRFIHPFTAIIAGPPVRESQCFACV